MADVAGNTDDAHRARQRGLRDRPASSPASSRPMRACSATPAASTRPRDVIAEFEAQGLTHPLVDAVKAAIDAEAAPRPVRRRACRPAPPRCSTASASRSPATAAPTIALVFLRLGIYLDPERRRDRPRRSASSRWRRPARAGQRASTTACPPTSPMKPMAVVRIAENLDAMGDRDEAIRRLGNIVTANPDDLDALSVLGDLLARRRAIRRGRRRLHQGARAHRRRAPGDWRFYYVRGIAYERNKQWPKAEADFLKALELNPDQPQVLNYLGYSWVDQGINLDRALEMIEKAVERRAQRRLHHRQPRLGLLPARPLRRSGRAARAGGAAPPQRSRDQRPPRRRLLARRPQARGEFQWNVAAAVDDEGNVKERVHAQARRAASMRVAR